MFSDLWIELVVVLAAPGVVLGSYGDDDVSSLGLGSAKMEGFNDGFSFGPVSTDDGSSRFELEYTRFSGLACFSAFVDEKEIPLALDFTHSPSSFLFSANEVRGRLGDSGLPVLGWEHANTDSLLDGNEEEMKEEQGHEPLVPESVRFDRFAWEGRYVRAHLKFGGMIDEDFEFGLVENRGTLVHSEFAEVAGLISFTPHSPLMKGKALVMEYRDSTISKSAPRVAVKLQQNKYRKETDTFSFPLVKAEGAADYTQWRIRTECFLAGSSLGGMDVVIDPSSPDILLPSTLFESLKGLTEMSVVEQVGIDDRLFVSVGKKIDGLIEFKATATAGFTTRVLKTTQEFFGHPLEKQEQVIKIRPLSLEYPLDFVVSERGRKMKPLRIRFVEGLDHVVLGQPLLQSYSSIILDNIRGSEKRRVRFVPPHWNNMEEPAQLPTTSIMEVDVDYDQLTEERFEKAENNESSQHSQWKSLTFKPVTRQSLEGGFVLWSLQFKNENGLSGIQVSLVHRFNSIKRKLTAEDPNLVNFSLAKRQIETSEGPTASLVRGIELAVSDHPSKNVAVFMVWSTGREVSVTLQEEYSENSGIARTRLSVVPESYGSEEKHLGSSIAKRIGGFFGLNA